MKITLFPGGTLTPASTCYDGVVKGISDIGMSVLGYTKGKFPLTEVIDLPLGYTNGMAATRLINRYYEKFKPKEFEEVKVLYLHAHGPGILHTKKTVSKLEEAQRPEDSLHRDSGQSRLGPGGSARVHAHGRNLRRPQPGDGGRVHGPHGVPGRMEMGGGGEVHHRELRLSLQHGVFRGHEQGDKWNALPADLQKTIEKINQEWVDKTGKVWDDIDKSGKEFSLKLGNKIIPLSKEENQRWAKAVTPVLDDYVKAMKEKGLPGDEALKFCLDFLKKSK